MNEKIFLSFMHFWRAATQFRFLGGSRPKMHKTQKYLLTILVYTKVNQIKQCSDIFEDSAILPLPLVK